LLVCADECLTKPLRKPDLLATINKVVLQVRALGQPDPSPCDADALLHFRRDERIRLVLRPSS
jgi:hypothetical protein